MDRSLDDVIRNRKGSHRLKLRRPQINPSGRGQQGIINKFDARQKISRSPKVVDARQKLQSKKSQTFDARQKLQSKPTDARARINSKKASAAKHISARQERNLDARQSLSTSRKVPFKRPNLGLKGLKSPGTTKVLVTNLGRSLMNKTGVDTAVGSGAQGQLIKVVQQKPWMPKSTSVEIVMTPNSANGNQDSMGLSFQEFEKQRIGKKGNAPLTVTCINNKSSAVTRPEPQKTTRSMYADLENQSRPKQQTGNLPIPFVAFGSQNANNISITTSQPLRQTTANMNINTMPLKQAWTHQTSNLPLNDFDDIDIDMDDEVETIPPYTQPRALLPQKPKIQRISFTDSMPPKISHHTVNRATSRPTTTYTADPTSSIAARIANNNNMYSSGNRPVSAPVIKKSPVAQLTRKLPTYASPKKYQTAIDYDDDGDMLEDSDAETEMTAQEIDAATQGYKLLITNLHDSVTQNDIVELFGSVGRIKKACLVKPGTGEVVYINKEDAQSAIKNYNMRELDGVPMKVQLAANISQALSNRLGDVATKPIKSPVKANPAPSLSMNTIKQTVTQTVKKTTKPVPATEPVVMGTGPIKLYGDNPSPKAMSMTDSRTMSKDDEGIDVALVHKAMFKNKNKTEAHRPVTFTVKV